MAAMVNDPRLEEVQAEMEALSRQIRKVEANTDAVEAAIAGRGTFRGYYGEDVFLKHNLRTVQREMMKQLRRQERKLVIRRSTLLAQAAQAAQATTPPPTPQPKGGKRPRRVKKTRAANRLFEKENIKEQLACLLFVGDGTTSSRKSTRSRGPQLQPLKLEQAPEERDPD